ncbi:endonuclease/exonuclease/phosphatase family protein [Streptomyces sp. CAU 1734]|uniref:endonuclease/exonuclease/phosphatase family protein n=1 Tax=Streptomyces sp. CAU 1734 TaxID=3140360 RepID=UPI003261436C
MPVQHQFLRAVTWNLRDGGLDGGSEERLWAQAVILAGLRPDILALQECTHWDEQDERRLLRLCHQLGMACAMTAHSHVGDGRNFTALLHRPTRLRLIGRRNIGERVFRHALIRARLRPADADANDDSRDFLALATHLTHTDGETRLREARHLTDYAGHFPGTPGRALLLGDLNCFGIHDTEPDWDSLVARHLHSRYRYIAPDGIFGATDRRAFHALINSGWTDPRARTGQERAATVGYAYANEPVPLRLDHILVRGLPADAYWTHDTPDTRAASDHLPTALDTRLPGPVPASR